MLQSIYECFINNKYKSCGNLLKDDNITALRLFKELDTAQSRHIVPRKKKRFSCICIYSYTFLSHSLPRFISSRHASDASGRSLHKGKRLFPDFSQPQFTGSKFGALFQKSTRPFCRLVTTCKYMFLEAVECW